MKRETTINHFYFRTFAVDVPAQAGSQLGRNDVAGTQELGIETVLRQTLSVDQNLGRKGDEI